MKTFEELRDYINDEYSPQDMVCEQNDNGDYQIRCENDNEILISSKDIPEYKFSSHIGHDIQVACYGNEDKVWNISIECMDCNEVIFDIDNDEV